MHAGYDVAVVGGGAAGCVVAARLAGTGRSVVLLEAGPDPRPGLSPELLDGWTLPRPPDWGFAAEPDARGEAPTLRRSRILGGTSWLTRFALRGGAAEYDAWEALGNPGWGFDAVLPALRRLESDEEFGDRPWHGAAGPIPVTRYPDLERAAVLGALTEAAVAAGFAPVEDHNAPDAVGVGPMPMSSVAGRRVTTLPAYLPDGAAPEGLRIRTDAQVADVMLDGSRAVGVRLVDGEIVAADLVVLCAGTYGSPAILERSGIGRAADLHELGIVGRVDLPGVGQNLADHPAADIDLGYTGTARATPLLHVAATFHSSAAAASGPPDLMLWLAEPGLPDDPPQLMIDAVLLRPRSRGSVHVRSADPAARPVIRLPGLAEPTDVDRLVEGYRRAIDLASAPGVRRLCTGPVLPGPDEPAIADVVRSRAYSIPHVVGTCAMGPDPADGAVVDAGGRVHGLAGLIVADASIIPLPPSGFSHIPTIMVAERIAELVVGREGSGA